MGCRTSTYSKAYLLALSASNIEVDVELYEYSIYPRNRHSSDTKDELDIISSNLYQSTDLRSVFARLWEVDVEI